MSRITIKPQRSNHAGTVSVRYATTSPQAERMEARMAELDVAHGTEVKRLGALMIATRKKLYASAVRREG